MNAYTFGTDRIETHLENGELFIGDGEDKGVKDSLNCFVFYKGKRL